MTVGYRSTGLTHAFLKLAMLQHWDGRCAWCTNAIADTSSFELDHVLSKEKFTETVAARPELGLDFEVDDVENLAPLCVARRCNQKKSDSLDGGLAGAILDILERSKKKANKVRGSVAHMQKATGLEKSVLSLLAADVGDQRVKDLLRTYGTNLVGRLYRFDPVIVESATTSWPMWQENRSIMNFPCYDDVAVVVDVDLNAAGRAAFQVAQQLEQYGVKLGELIGSAAETIAPELDELAGHRGYPDSLPRVEGHSLSFDFRRRSIRFTMGCEAYRTYTGSTDYDTQERFVVGGPYEVRVKVRLDGTWLTKTRVKGYPSVHSEDFWSTEEPHDDLRE